MRALRCVLGVVAMVVCLLVVGGGVALAAPASFGNGEGEDAGQFIEPRGIAVEQESGDVYVADRNNQRVDKFGPGGEFLFAWGWGVADGHTEAPQTCTASCFTGVYGGGSGELKNPAGVAVDNDPLSASHGDVYVVDTSNGRVQKFDPAGNFLLMFGGGVNETTSGDVCLAGEACRAGTEGSEPGEFEQLGEGGGIAVDAAGNVYVGDLNRVQEFSPGGVSVAQIALPGAGGIEAVAVDSSGDVYVKGGELNGVRKFEGCAGSCVGVELGEPRDAAGEFNGFGRGFISLGASGELFVADGAAEGRSEHIREFDPSGVEVESFDASSEGGELGIAFANGIGGLYVLDRGRVRVVSLPLPGPLVVSVSAGELQPTTMGVSAVVNPEGHETSYHVEYGTTAAYGSSTPPATLAGSAFEDEPVSVGLSGLQPRTTYHFRVVASNSAGTAFGEDETFTTLPPASIDGESVSAVTSNSATLAAQINPLGRDTKYRFEYGATTAYGSSVPVSDGDAGSGTSDVALSVLVEGLTPSTVYHFRVVASNALGVVEGPDRVFTTQGGEVPVLPDGRAWEMVSPPEKRGAALEAIGADGGAEIQAAADGSEVAYVTRGSIVAQPKGNLSVGYSQILSKRTVDGWSSVDIAAPHGKVTGEPLRSFSEYQMFSRDLSVGLYEQPVSSAPGEDARLSPQATEETPYRWEANGEYTPLVTTANVPPGTRFGKHAVFVVGSISDMSHVILSSSVPLTEGIANTEGQNDLFEWASGSLRLVSVLPDGKAATEEDASALLGQEPDVRHAVSDDGSRIFWSASFSTSSGSRSLYLRDVNKNETVQLNAVEAGAQGGLSAPVFTTANSDGSKAFFTDVSRLTSDSSASVGGSKPDLYMCVVGEVAGKLACRLKDLTVDHNPGESADVRGTVMGAGEDGRYVYFVANGVLAAGATPGNCAIQRDGGACNLYVYDTVLGEARFVARLSAKDFPDWETAGGGGGGEELFHLAAGVSPDGRYLAFMSERSLTGYDNTDVHSGQSDEEVFLFDAGTGRVVCASCDPSGARPSGVFDPGGTRTSGAAAALLVDDPGIWVDRWLAGSIPGWTNTRTSTAYYRSRYLSDSGRLFFDSADALVPRDANGKEDVYEFEPGGAGGCARPGGCVGLISSGTSGEESAFLDASETGDDVFFLTASQLVPQDVDRSLDVYDARVCSVSSPCLASPPAGSPVCATADACRAAFSSQPAVFGAPSSATFSGAGNPAANTNKPAVKKKVLTVAQKRAAALRKCRSKPTRKRTACEARARKSYPVGIKAKRSRDGVTTRRGSR